MNRPHADHAARRQPPPVDLLPTDRPEITPEAPKELGGRLAGLTLWQQVGVLAIWPFFEQLLNWFVSFVDTALAGHLSAEAMNAIGVAGYIGWLIGMLQMAVAIGAKVIISRAVGGRHRSAANAAVGQAVLLAVICGTLTGAFVFFAGETVGRIAKLEGESLRLCTLYLRIIAVSAPLSALLFVSNACMRGGGDTRSPFIIMLVVNIVNTALSMFFVQGPEPWGGRGVSGIAWGTVAGWSIGAAFALSVLVFGTGQVRLRLPRMRPHWHTIKRIIRVGVPNLFESLGQWGGNFLILIIVGVIGQRTGKDVWAAHIGGIRIEALSFLPGMALGEAASTLVGLYLGLGDPKRAKRAGILCWFVAMAVMAVIGITFIVMPGWWIRLVTADEDVINLTIPLLWICGPIQVFFATYIVFSNAMRGAGDTLRTMQVTFSTTFLVRLPLCYLIGVVLELGLLGVWYALCGELVVRGSLFAWRYFQGKWITVRV